MHYNEDNRIIITDEDQCSTCRRYTQCPLIDGLFNQYFFFDVEDDINIVNCELYEERVQLRIVKD